MEDLIEKAFQTDTRVGLGDFNFDQTTEIVPPKKNAWRGKIPPAALSRLLPLIAEEMSAAGYKVPKAPGPISREDSVRQFQMAAAFKQNKNRTKG